MTMPYTSEADLPALTEEEFTAFRNTARAYTLMLLRAGPNFERPDAKFESPVGRTIWAHGKRNVALHEAGLLRVVCPVSDGSGLCGIGVFYAEPDEVTRIMDADPGVVAGVFTYEVHPTRSFPGSTL
jgi:hypothetical protein